MKKPEEQKINALTEEIIDNPALKTGSDEATATAKMNLFEAVGKGLAPDYGVESSDFDGLIKQLTNINRSVPTIRQNGKSTWTMPPYQVTDGNASGWTIYGETHKSDKEWITELKEQMIDILTRSMEDNYYYEEGNIVVLKDSITSNVKNGYSIVVWFEKDENGNLIYDPDKAGWAFSLNSASDVATLDLDVLKSIRKTHTMLNRVDRLLEDGDADI